MTALRTGRLRVAAAAVTAAALLAGCAAGSTPKLPSAGTTASSSAAPTVAPTPLPGCSNDNSTRVASYAPTSASDALTGKTVAAIRERGKLKAAVSADNLLFGFRDPITNQLEGFDIDMIRSVAVAIFGGTLATIDSKIEYQVVNFAQRIPALQAGQAGKPGQADIVADIMTINCTRWSQIDFSAEYFGASQQLLVPRGSNLTIAKMNGKKVCTARGSTGSENLKTYAAVLPVLVDNISDCMVLFQQGSVDGVISDNTVVAGFASQDPYAVVVDQKLTDEPYGLGFRKGQTDFVQFVNALLERMRADGSWQKLYAHWLLATLGSGPGTGQPTPVYGR
jgi:polar amino acid transport system substrate-binding protein